MKKIIAGSLLVLASNFSMANELGSNIECTLTSDYGKETLDIMFNESDLYCGRDNYKYQSVMVSKINAGEYAHERSANVGTIVIKNNNFTYRNTTKYGRNSYQQVLKINGETGVGTFKKVTENWDTGAIGLKTFPVKCLITQVHMDC